MEMNDLKIGDRVKVVSDPRFINVTGKDSIIGMTGTVKDLHEPCAGVEFDDYMGGHNGSWNGKKGYCWYIHHKRLEKIEETKEETKEEVEEMEKDVNTEGKSETIKQKVFEVLRKEIGVEIGEEFDVYKKGNMLWRCKFEENGFFRRGIYGFLKSENWKDIIGNFYNYTFKRKLFVPKYEERYFSLVAGHDENNNIKFKVLQSTWRDGVVDYSMLALGNVFRSKEEALASKDKLLERLNELLKEEQIWEN